MPSYLLGVIIQSDFHVKMSRGHCPTIVAPSHGMSLLSAFVHSFYLRSVTPYALHLYIVPFCAAPPKVEPISPHLIWLKVTVGAFSIC
jgi:hypothetical protein